jgi:simple sugar transport system permease protein
MQKIENRVNILKTAVAILVSYGLAFGVILLVSATPGRALWAFALGPFTSLRRFGNVLEGMIPIVFTGVGVSIMVSARFFNLAASGAFYLAAVIGAGVALVPMPPGLHPLAGILLGGLAGAGVCVLPALLKTRWAVNEVVSALMFNYIATYLGSYILRFWLFDPAAGFMASRVFYKTVSLPVILPGTRVHLGLVFAALAVALAFVFLYHTKWGYAIRMTGLSKDFAAFSGIGFVSAVTASQLIGGFVVGVGGACEMYGMYTRFQWTDLPTTGFDGVIVAALARRNPAAAPLAAFFLSYIRVGADVMARNSDVASEIVYVIQAIIILLIGAEHLLGRLRVRALANVKGAGEAWTRR